jgi:hypothetical protein
MPSVLASYRIHPTSMLHRTNRTSENIAHRLRVKFRDLAARYPGMDSYFGFPSTGSPIVSNQQARRDADQMYQLCDELERQLASVYASKSWRVTRPLRWVYGVLAHRKTPPA